MITVGVTAEINVEELQDDIATVPSDFFPVEDFSALFEDVQGIIDAVSAKC